MLGEAGSPWRRSRPAQVARQTQPDCVDPRRVRFPSGQRHLSPRRARAAGPNSVDYPDLYGLHARLLAEPGKDPGRSHCEAMDATTGWVRGTQGAAQLNVLRQDVYVPALPDDEYLAAVGRTVYLLNGLEWLVIEVVRRLDPSTSIELLAGMTSYGIAEQLAAKVRGVSGLRPEQATELQRLAGAYAALPPVRNDATHARPATMPDGRQRLYRWAPTKTRFTGWIDEPALTDLCQRAAQLEGGFDAARSWLPPLPALRAPPLAHDGSRAAYR